MRILKVIATGFAALFLLALIGVGVGFYMLSDYARELPEYQQLAHYQPPVTTRVHAGDGRLIAEYARERRLFVPVEAIPQAVIDAFLSAEDKRFYEHNGLDFMGILRAAVTNVPRLLAGKRPTGASTITQQVAKNFLLTNELSFDRKIKEALLALRIEKAFDKNQILELYLNEIYLGRRSFGVAAAALNYFDKSLDDLTIAEAAYLAALPKAPNNYHPVRFHDRALGRRNWVISRMRDTGRISPEVAAVAAAEPLVTVDGSETEIVSAEWFTEEVRRELAVRYGEETLYEEGLSVRTTMDTRLQQIGEQALRDGLMAYDRRHGYRGPVAQIDVGGEWQAEFATLAPPVGLLPGWRLAIVLALGDGEAEIAVLNRSDDPEQPGEPTFEPGVIALPDVEWARRATDDGVGPPVKRIGDVFAPGDVVVVTRDFDTGADAFSLRQIPEINGSLVALDPHTGRILALIGGWSYDASQFSRATQALRQPGSAFKPIVYAAALENGFTPSSLILDAPFVIDQGHGLGKWKPANYTRRFYGPSTLRLGIEKSRNLMTVRLAQHIGMEKIADYAERFGVVDYLPEQLAMALGAGETTLLRLTAAYAMLVNGGQRIQPSLIDRIQDRRGRTIFRHDQRACVGCRVEAWRNQPEPVIPDDREQVIESVTAYQLVSMLQGVVERGTGRRVSQVGKPLAGKTGTTNDSRDAWFIGFSPDLVVGVYTGFDNPKSLGKRETGSSVAAPIFRDFMAAALAEQPAIPFRIPASVRLVRVDVASGLPAGPGVRNVIFEAFRPGTEPTRDRTVLDGSDRAGDGVAVSPATGSGLY